MPTLTPVIPSALPKEVEKPIPVRTVQTRLTPKAAPDRDQQVIDKGLTVPAAADSAPTADSVKLSPQLSALARKEQEFRKKSQALEAKEKSLEARLSDADKFLKLQERFKAKDFSAFEELGLDYESYTSYLLNKQNPDPQKDEVQKLAEELASMKQSQSAKEEEEFETNKKEYRSRIKELVGSDPEFSSVKELGREEVVLQLILDSVEEDEPELKDLDFEGAIKWALKIVEMDAVEEGKRFTTLSKLKSKEEPKAAEPEMAKLPKPPSSLKTLTNQATVGGPDNAAPLKSLQHLSYDERIAEARRRVMARKQSQ